MSETPAPQAEDITQQATAPTPKIKPATEKNPKRVAAGKATAQKPKLAREAQKNAAEETAAIIVNNKAAEPSPEPSPEKPGPATPAVLGGTTTQWLALGSLVVSLIGLYYKQEEIKNVLSKKNLAPQALPPQPPPQAPPARGLRNMDKLFYM